MMDLKYHIEASDLIEAIKQHQTEDPGYIQTRLYIINAMNPDHGASFTLAEIKREAIQILLQGLERDLATLETVTTEIQKLL